jgi:hypothetical protein
MKQVGTALIRALVKDGMRAIKWGGWVVRKAWP